jgi:Ser/Thr protein kinase RdoA (MazF antagonist)
MKKIPTTTPLSSSTAAKRRLAERVAALYGIQALSISAPQKGYRNQSFRLERPGKAPVNLIVYKSEPHILERIHNAHRIGEFLYEADWPVRYAYNPRIATLQNSHRLAYAAIYNYLPGHTIPWEGYTRKHIKLLGKTMSDMHAVLENTALSTTSVMDEYRAIIKRMERYFSDEKVIEAMAHKLGVSLIAHFAYYKKLLMFCERSPQQTLHMDLVRGNILFDGEGESLRISGIIDFEKAAVGPKYFDIARTLAFLLVDCKYIEEQKVRKYFLYSGYEKYGKSSLAGVPELQLLENLLDMFLIYDFYKFLRHNPYEYLEQNEHFIRTRNLLQKRQRLSVHKA